MKRNYLRSGRHILLLLPAFLLIFILAGFISPTEEVFAQTDNPSTPTDSTSNVACLSCHAEAYNPVSLPNGEVLYIQIDMTKFANSVHDRNEVTCVQCHTNITGFPHPQKTAQTLHDFQLEVDASCVECHEDQALMTQDSIHGQLLAQGDQYAPTCSNCHDPHAQPYVDEWDKVQHSEVCGNCHSGIFEEYANSVHGDAMINDDNQDVPGCIDCHGVHTMADTGTAEFRNSSIYMCADCHTNAEIMGKYDIPTDVLDTYVADFHGTTVTLFEKTEPGQTTNKAVCYDCHGIHNILSVNDPNKGLSVKQNMLVACQSCHPDATTNFPDSWLSHYRPDKDQYPIVYYVTLFYKWLIPVVLGGMAVFVSSDIFRRLKTLIFKPKSEKVVNNEGKEDSNND